MGANMDRTRAIINAFKQGNAGNCASVAAIKASIHAFGVDGLFKSLTVGEDNSVEVTLRDHSDSNDQRYHLDADYLELAKHLSNFVPGNDAMILHRAQVAFAAMCARVQKYGNDGIAPGMSLEDAAKTLNDGEYYVEAAETLGLGPHMVLLSGGPVKRWFRAGNFLEHWETCVAASRHHAWFVSRGLADWYGKVDRMEVIDFRGARLANVGGAYALRS